MAWAGAGPDGPAVGHRARCGLPLGRLLAICAVALTTANCANNPQKFAGGAGSSDIDPKYGVRASKRLYNEGDAIPKGGGRRYSGKPYVVAGRTYVPREDAHGYVREGLASWYGSAFHGRLTANGEVFDRHSIAAAHPTLPLPSYARVTNLDSGYSMVVRVNDRGPYHENRVMDVSEEAARALDFHRRGTARVRVEYLGKASIAGSDDRKLLATLRTDGRPAAIGARSPVMMADLGPDAGGPSTERLTRPTRPALAFREADEAAPPAQAPERVRPAPVLVASRSSVAVPAVIQPTARRSLAFATGTHAVAEAAPVRGPVRNTSNAPLSLAPPPLKLASADRAHSGRSEPVAAVGRDRSASHTATASNVAMPSASKLAMAKLAAAAAPAKGGASAKAQDGRTGPEARSARRRVAGID